jgi:hypothetical protein
MYVRCLDCGYDSGPSGWRISNGVLVPSPARKEETLMTWTSERPAVPGVYWFKTTWNGRTFGPQVVEVTTETSAVGSLYMYYCGSDEDALLNDDFFTSDYGRGSQWYGPIQPPL